MIEYATRTDLIRLVPEHAVMAEIGVFRGEFSQEIMDVCRPKALFLVDIWTGRFGSGDKDGRHHTEVPDMLKTYLDLAMRHAGSSGVHLVRSDSKSFFDGWSAGFFDAVYIDADHTYDAVFMDLAGSLKVLKPGGLLMGHDYHGDVKRAVDDFCGYHHLEISAIARDGCPSFLVRLPVNDL